MEVKVKTLCKYIREELNENFLLPETEVRKLLTS